MGYAEEAVHHFNLSGSIASFRDLTQAKALEACLSRCNEAKEHKNWTTLLRHTHEAVAMGADSSLQEWYVGYPPLLTLTCADYWVVDFDSDF